MLALAVIAFGALLFRRAAAARMAQCRSGLPGADRNAYRPRAADASARLFQHPAALRRADGGGAGLRAARPRVALAAAGASPARSGSRRSAPRSTCRPGRSRGAGSSIRCAGSSSSCSASSWATTRDSARACGACSPGRAGRRCRSSRRRGGRGGELVARSAAGALAAAALHLRQDLPVAGPRHPVLRPRALRRGALPHIPTWLAPVAGYFAMLGRNSLNVFCVASVLSLAAQIMRFACGASFATDTIVLITGLLAMGLSAWVSEWRDRFGVASSSAGADRSSRCLSGGACRADRAAVRRRHAGQPQPLGDAARRHRRRDRLAPETRPSPCRRR